MPEYFAPGIYIEEVPGGARPIQRVGTRTAGFVGVAQDPDKHVNEVVAINNWLHFVREFTAPDRPSTPLSNAVYGFFLNGGSRCYVVNVGPGNPVAGGGRERRGLDLLAQVDEIAMIAIPGYTDVASYEAALAHCENLKDRVAILDAPEGVTDVDLLTKVATAPPPTATAPRRASEASKSSRSRGSAGAAGAGGEEGAAATTEGGVRARNSAFGTEYVPWITMRDPFTNALVNVPPSGHIAGIWARSDATRGVQKAPANEPVRGALNVAYNFTRDEQGVLNQAGVNCIRLFQSEGIRVWGARTLDDGEWRYLNVRRLFNMIEESIEESTRWIVFEPNDRTLWKSIRRDISAFLTILWRDGALMGRTPEEAFFVKCDEETNPPEVIDAGMVVTIIGIAPVKPAEFIIFRISQFQGGAQSEVQGVANA
jgi:phage tail sheath protein FI